MTILQTGSADTNFGSPATLTLPTALTAGATLIISAVTYAGAPITGLTVNGNPATPLVSNGEGADSWTYVASGGETSLSFSTTGSGVLGVCWVEDDEITGVHQVDPFTSSDDGYTDEHDFDINIDTPFAGGLVVGVLWMSNSREITGAGGTNVVQLNEPSPMGLLYKAVGAGGANQLAITLNEATNASAALAVLSYGSGGGGGFNPAWARNANTIIGA